MNGDDPFDGRRPLRAPEPLAAFVDAGVLEAADVHLATTLQSIGGDTDAHVALAVALAARGVRHGSVAVDLATVATALTVESEGDGDGLGTLDWPEAAAWAAAVAVSPLVAVGDDPAPEPHARRPVRLLGTQVALDRYWQHERVIAAELLGRTTAEAFPLAVTSAQLDALCGAQDSPGARQRLAVSTAAANRLAVIAGGPGTGKTTTIAAIVALLLHETADDERPPRIALAAPTGKAAARLTEAVHDQARDLTASGRVPPAVADAMLATDASTLHRLLGRHPGSNSRFRHDQTNRLPHDAVIVDETSMVPLSMMARLLGAVNGDARLVLVGDPQQLASVEAGAVLGDIVAAGSTDGPMRPHVVTLDYVHRFAGGVGALADAIVRGDADAAIDVLVAADSNVEWLDADVATAEGHKAASDRIGPLLVETASVVVAAARDGDAARALAAMGRAQVLCAHRRGPHGVATWRREVERWLSAEIADFVPYGWFAGRPLIVTENDYALGLFNGDTGVAVQSAGAALGPPADKDAGRSPVPAIVGAFERRGEIVEVNPSRLRAVETLYAMTIHKSQGSQFAHPVVILPDESSPILTRELLYTAVTRATDQVTVIGTEAAIRAAVDRPVQRASGLTDRLTTR